LINALGLKPDVELNFERQGDAIVIRPEKPTNAIGGRRRETTGSCSPISWHSKVGFAIVG